MTHKHRCRKCGTVWQHSRARITMSQLKRALVDAAYNKRLRRDTEHECPVCGEPEFDTYTGTKKAEFRHTHTVTRKLKK